MLYNPPVGGLPNDPYVTGNPTSATPGSIPSGQSIEYPQREIINAIIAGGLTPSNSDLFQLAKAIQGDGMCTSMATGTSDSIIGEFSPPISSITTPIVLYVRALEENLTETPIFTPASGIIAPEIIVKGPNLPLAVGDIAGLGHSLCLQWDPTWSKWILLNPATGVLGLPTSSNFDVGTRLVFAQASAPTGWTQDVSDAANNRMLRVVNTAGGSVGGSADPTINNVVPAHTHGFTTGIESASHTHVLTDPGHSHAPSVGSSFVTSPSGSWNGVSGGVNGNYAGGATTASAVTGITASIESANHYHAGSTDNGSSSTNWTPRYNSVIICTKN